MASPARGRLLALEGIDGCGKTKQAELLAESLGAVLTREPGATELGADLRHLLLDTDAPPFGARTEALLMAADRAQHVDAVIAPALDAGQNVVTDRYSGSTLAYQGFGRGLGQGELEGLIEFATNGLRADLSILVDVPLELSAARLAGHAPDRLERLDQAFHQRVREGFLALAAADPDHWVVVDGSLSISAVAEEILGLVTDCFGFGR